MSQIDGHIRVMVVDIHRIVLSGLQRLIDDARPLMGVVATATSCVEAVEVANTANPDVVVLDADLAQDDDGGIVASLINGRNSRVLILSDSRGDKKHEAAILRGACGVVRKDESPQTLIKAIEKVHDGQLWLDRSTTGRLFVELSRQKTDPVVDPEKRKLASLTAREQDVIRTLVTEPGSDNKRLATTLHIGEHTLRNHLSRIYDKLGVPNRLELYVFAQRHGVTRHRRI